MDYKPIVTRSLAGQIADVIQQAIPDGSLIPNGGCGARGETGTPARGVAPHRAAGADAACGPASDPLPPRPHGRQLRQRPPARGAVRQLRHGGSVADRDGWRRPGRYRTARFEMEAVCCRLAAARIKAHDVVTLRDERAQKRDPALSDEEFCASDVRFHRAIVQASGNPVLRFVTNVIVEADGALIAHRRDQFGRRGSA